MSTPTEKTRSAQQLVVEYLNRRRAHCIRQAEYFQANEGVGCAGAVSNDDVAQELAAVICFVETIFDMEPSLEAALDE